MLLRCTATGLGRAAVASEGELGLPSADMCSDCAFMVMQVTRNYTDRCYGNSLQVATSSTELLDNFSRENNFVYKVGFDVEPELKWTGDYKKLKACPFLLTLPAPQRDDLHVCSFGSLCNNLWIWCRWRCKLQATRPQTRQRWSSALRRPSRTAWAPSEWSAAGGWPRVTSQC